MLPLQLARSLEAPLEVLCLGPHCDDIEIGAGGTILRLIETRPRLRFHWKIFCSTPERREESLSSARSFLGDVPADIVVDGFRDGFLPAQWGEAKEAFERLKGEVQPDLILTPTRSDLHQDHRVVSELTRNTFRNHAILEYEIPKYDGDLGAPSAFVPLTEAQVSRKAELIVEGFPSQRGRSWFTEETFRSLARLRGIECNAPDGYAEAFYAPKLVLEP